MKIDLSDLNEAYREVRGGKLPDGVYQAKLLKAEVCPSKAGRRQIVWEMQVQDQPPGRAILVRKYSQLHPGCMYWLDSDLKKLGITLDHINDLHQALRDLVGAAIEIDLETTGEYYTANFIRVLSRAA